MTQISIATPARPRRRPSQRITTVPQLVAFLCADRRRRVRKTCSPSGVTYEAGGVLVDSTAVREAIEHGRLRPVDPGLFGGFAQSWDLPV
jgi:hypothetical protein